MGIIHIESTGFSTWDDDDLKRLEELEAEYAKLPQPEIGKVYLALFHGRVRPDQQLNDWGFEGPLVGPIRALHVTYQTTYNLFFVDDATAQAFGFPDAEENELEFVNGLLHYKGGYFGDWEIQVYDPRPPEVLIEGYAFRAYNKVPVSEIARVFGNDAMRVYGALAYVGQPLSDSGIDQDTLAGAIRRAGLAK